MPKDEKKPWWKFELRSMAAGAAAIIPVIWILWQMYAALTPPGPELSVASNYGPFSLPPYILSEPREATSDTDTLDIPTADLKRFSGYIELSITNTGDRPALEVTVQCDRGGYADVRSETAGDSHADFESVVSIGKLIQKETVTVTLWTNEVVTEQTELVISHTLGVVTHRLKEQRSWVFFVAFMLIGVVVGAITPYLTIRHVNQRMRHLTEETTATLEASKVLLRQAGEVEASAKDAAMRAEERLKELEATKNMRSTPTEPPE